MSLEKRSESGSNVDDYHRECLHLAGGVDLIIKTREPTEVDFNERYQDSGSIITEELSHVNFEIVQRDSDESPWPNAEILDAESYDGDEPCRAHHPDDPECGREADYRVMFGAERFDRPRTFLAAAECVEIPDDILSDTESLQTGKENDCSEQEEA